MSDDRDLLLRWLQGEVSPQEEGSLGERLRSEPELRAALERVEKISTLLQAEGARSFAPGFSSRVMRRLGREPRKSQAEIVYESLRWAFARVAVACLVLVLGVATYSVVGGGSGLSASLLESVLGLPATTLEAALLLAAA